MLDFKVVCAWCNKVMEIGEPGAEVSHGICKDCVNTFFKEVFEDPNRETNRGGEL